MLNPRFFAVVAAFTLIAACSSSETATTSNSSASSASSNGGAAGEGGAGASGAGSAVGGSAGSGGQGGEGGQGCDASNCNGPGQLCLNGNCITDCRRPGSVPCVDPTVCNYSDDNPGQCVDPEQQDCVISGPAVSCGSVSCGPGSSCDGAGSCYSALPCVSLVCDGDDCWGEACLCQRPPAACTPAPLGTPGQIGSLNDPAFTRCADLGNCNGGIIDLDFDQSCNAFGVTYLSGPDYLRRIDTQGTVESWAGVTNLNMGEVAARQGDAGTFGAGNLEDVVSLSYICCPTCGCQIGPGGDPQGVALLDKMSATLPMMIPSSTFTQGSGPFGQQKLDTGPYGLSWGLDEVLYVGNTDSNGQYHALDLTAQSKILLETFGSRVHASAPFDKYNMLVALGGGEIRRVPVLGATPGSSTVISLSTDVTSLQRDSWSGRVYASLNDLSIVSFAADGSDLQVFQTAPGLGRIAIAPDGYLYHLTGGFPSTPTITRWPLPTEL